VTKPRQPCNEIGVSSPHSGTCASRTTRPGPEADDGPSEPLAPFT